MDIIKRLMEHFISSKKDLLCVILKDESVDVSISSNGETKGLTRKELPNLQFDEDKYLQNLADVLRDKISWLENLNDTRIVFLLGERLIETERFVLPVMPKKDEQEAIDWEVAESINYERDSYYYKVVRAKEKLGEEYQYTVYAAPKSFVEKLVGMTNGFNIKFAYVIPQIDKEQFVDVNRINLCPEDLQENDFDECLTKWSKYVLTICIFIVVLIMGGMEIFLYTKNTQLSGLEENLQKEAFWKASYQSARSMEQETKRLNLTLKRLDDASLKQSHVLEALGRSTVSGLWITGIESEGVIYKITGRSLDMQGVNAWTEELSLSSDFKDVKILSTDARSTGISFVANISER
ncbi:MAG: PilN domain-containing protein [Phascolarctobacterium sp.]|nr:PilN domain-containing protein [Phascolarctobacterium sp.]